MADKVRVAIIGLGFGAEFIPIYQRHPNAEMYAICRRDRTELDAVGDRFGVKTRYTSYDELLNDPSAPFRDSSMLGRNAVASAAPAIHDRAMGQRSTTTARPNRAVIGAGRRCVEPSSARSGSPRRLARAACQRADETDPRFSSRGTAEAMVLSVVAVLGVAALGGGIAAGLSLLIVVAVAALGVVAVVSAVAVMQQLHDAFGD